MVEVTSVSHMWKLIRLYSQDQCSLLNVCYALQVRNLSIEVPYPQHGPQTQYSLSNFFSVYYNSKEESCSGSQAFMKAWGTTGCDIMCTQTSFWILRSTWQCLLLPRGCKFLPSLSHTSGTMGDTVAFVSLSTIPLLPFFWVLKLSIALAFSSPSKKFQGAEAGSRNWYNHYGI